MNITAVLTDVRRVGSCLVGNIRRDTRGRFRDGELIRTSEVMSEDGSIIQTRNSTYFVESWA